jgi:FKBP-type peptidyl-prolyl cis-trans isomerase 2
MEIKQGDFVEIEFIGKIIEGDIFDTNIAEELKKLGRENQEIIKSICIGEGMLLKSIDDFLIGKDLGKYTLSLPPEKAFGVRKKELIKTMPISVFNSSQQKPQVGMLFTFDNMIGKISAVSGGRVVVDFNNQLSGKNVYYELNVKSIITEENEKIKSLMNYFFRKELPFKVKDKKLVIEAEKNYIDFILLFKDTFKKILNLDLEMIEMKNKEKQ